MSNLIVLTPRQKQVFEYIQSYIKENNNGPTLSQIDEALGIGSVPAVFQHVEALRKKGFLKKLPHQPRSISILDKDDENVEISLLGSIALGEPIESFPDPEQINIPVVLTSGSGEHYALQAKGNSMKDLGILGGDILVIKNTNQAENGDIIVAITEEGATLKRFYDHGDKIELKPSNEELQSKFYRKGEVEVRGKFSGLIRKGPVLGQIEKPMSQER